MRMTPGMPEAQFEQAPRARPLPDGRWVTDVMLQVPLDYIEQYRQGYRCLRCHHAQSQPFPEVCEEHPDVCNYRIADEQTDYFRRIFEGPEAISLEEMLGVHFADDLAAEEGGELAEIAAEKRKHHIWLPPGSEHLGMEE